MPRLPHPKLRAVLTAAMTVSALAVSSGVATAGPTPIPQDDTAPCVQRAGAPTDRWFCPLTQNMVPVYVAPDPRSEQIGWLHVAGPANNPRNFFLHQVHTLTYVPPGKPGVANNWWGFTQADRAGRKPRDSGWGYVPEAYFKGGTSFVPDKTLPKRVASRCGADKHFC